MVLVDYVFYNLMAPTLKPNNFIGKVWFLTNLVWFERSRTGLFNGTKFVKNGTMGTKLWTSKVEPVLGKTVLGKTVRTG